MDETFSLAVIGTVVADGSGFAINLHACFAPALHGLEGFTHAHVLWWADHSATDDDRALLVCQRPYTNSEADFGVFATRSPARPNPIAMSVVAIGAVDPKDGRISVPYIDAELGTPVLDIKPYFPASDRVTAAGTPSWCAHWPQDLEGSAAFDWYGEFR